MRTSPETEQNDRFQSGKLNLGAAKFLNYCPSAAQYFVNWSRQPFQPRW